MKRKILFSIALIVLLVLLIFLIIYLSQLDSLINAISLVLSVLALIVSLVTAFKNELFPFRLVLFIDAIYLVAGELMPPKSGVSVQVLLPITFINRGYSEGIVENIFLDVTKENEKTVYKFLPAMEVDMVALMQQKKGINSSNMLGMFHGFLLGQKQGHKKNVIFTPSVTNDEPEFYWSPGIYTLKLYVKVYGERKSTPPFVMKQNIHANALDLLLSRNVQVLYMYPENQ